MSFEAMQIPNDLDCHETKGLIGSISASRNQTRKTIFHWTPSKICSLASAIAPIELELVVTVIRATIPYIVQFVPNAEFLMLAMSLSESKVEINVVYALQPLVLKWLVVLACTIMVQLTSFKTFHQVMIHGPSQTLHEFKPTDETPFRALFVVYVVLLHYR